MENTKHEKHKTVIPGTSRAGMKVNFQMCVSLVFCRKVTLTRLLHAHTTTHPSVYKLGCTKCFVVVFFCWRLSFGTPLLRLLFVSTLCGRCFCSSLKICHDDIFAVLSVFRVVRCGCGVGVGVGWVCCVLVSFVRKNWISNWVFPTPMCETRRNRQCQA